VALIDLVSSVKLNSCFNFENFANHQFNIEIVNCTSTMLPSRLRDLLGREVDVVIEHGLKPRIRDRVLKEAELL